MYLIDSNILIYSYDAERQYLRELFDHKNTFVSEISRIEVLGYHRLSIEEDLYFRDIFEFLPILVSDQKVFDKALELRREFNLKLGDSIIAATALVHRLSIYSRNLSDFGRVDALKCLNPVQ